MRRWLFVVVAVVLGLTVFLWGRSRPTELQAAVRTGELVRLHVVADNDTDHAQSAKLYVRDAILKYFAPLFAQVDGAKEAARAVETHLEQAEAVAGQAAREVGFTGQVKASFGVYPFPERVYAGQVVPAGEYLALRVVMGKGEGHNWWCVMYPPLCFVGEECASLNQVEFESSVLNWLKSLKDKESEK